jgi:hypothetical protein
MKKLLIAGLLATAFTGSAMAETIVYSNSSVIMPSTQYVVASPVMVSAPVVRSYVVASPMVISQPAVISASPVVYTSGTYCNSSPVVTTYYSY